MGNNNLQVTPRIFLNDNIKTLETYRSPKRKYDFRAFAASAMLAISENDKAMEALKTPLGQATLMMALKKAARIGLSLAPGEGQACLIAYGSSIQYQVMKDGYIELAMETGAVEALRAEVVRDGDTINTVSSLRDGDSITHTIDRKTNRGEIIGAYAEMLLTNGKTYIYYMDRGELDERRKASKGGPLWANYYEAACKKTVVKDLLRKTHLKALRSAKQLIDEDYDLPPEPTDATPPKGMIPDDIPGAIDAAKPEPVNITPPKENPKPQVQEGEFFGE